MIDIAPNDLVACICEGKTEKTILEILLDGNTLCFSREQLLNGEILSGKYRKSLNFQQDFLTLDYEGQKIVILLIQDRLTSYKLNSMYVKQVKGVYPLVTKPEVEMLMVHSLKEYEEYKKQKEKPSIFLQRKLHVKGSVLKSNKYICAFYEEHDLVEAIKKYKKGKSMKYGLIDIVRK